MQYNISPETLVDERHPTATVDRILNREIKIEGEYAVCPNGAQYRKDVRGFLPELMEMMYGDRVVFKKKMLAAKQQYEKTPTKALEKEIARCNNIQMAKKISLNSAYGAIGNQYFRYYKLANAEAITLSGQVSIRWIENKMNQYLNRVLKTEDNDYVIASDTDSIYLNMDPLVNAVYKERERTTESVVSFLNKVCEKELEGYIEGCYQELAGYVNAYDQKMQMKRENIADRGIWTAKKRYILNVYDSEGVRYAEPKLKIMGIEAIKSSTPAYCRTKIKEALKLIMSGTEDEVIEYMESVREEFNKLSPEEVSFPRTVSDVDKYKSSCSIYAKGTPIHSKGALIYNYYVKKAKLDNKYSIIKNGEKVKYCYLKLPNPIRETVITFIQQFPHDLDLAKYVDYDTQFDKAFMKPLKSIMDVIGWKTEKVNTLESFFS
jgi:DNA polymerase elongation subunit (family B)